MHIHCIAHDYSLSMLFDMIWQKNLIFITILLFTLIN